MSVFKVGDRVRCIDPGQPGNYLELGREYSVLETDGHTVMVEPGRGVYEWRFEHVKAPVGQLARFNGETWDPIEEQTLEVADGGWWDVPYDRVVVKGGGIDTAIKESLGLEVRVQVRRKTDS